MDWNILIINITIGNIIGTPNSANKNIVGKFKPNPMYIYTIPNH